MTSCNIRDNFKDWPLSKLRATCWNNTVRSSSGLVFATTEKRSNENQQNQPVWFNFLSTRIEGYLHVGVLIVSYCSFISVRQSRYFECYCPVRCNGQSNPISQMSQFSSRGEHHFHKIPWIFGPDIFGQMKQIISTHLQ